MDRGEPRKKKKYRPLYKKGGHGRCKKWCKQNGKNKKYKR